MIQEVGEAMSWQLEKLTLGYLRAQQTILSFFYIDALYALCVFENLHSTCLSFITNGLWDF